MSNLLNSTNPPYLLSKQGNSANTFVEKNLRRKMESIFVLDGTYMKDWDEFSTSMAHKFKFPEYNGDNWDAFSDLMRDLSWLDLKELVIIVDNAEHLFFGKLKEQQIFQESMNVFGNYWSDPAENGGWHDDTPMPFHVILYSNKPLVGYNAPLYRELR